MEDQIKELIAKGIKLDYREIYEDNAVILRWGDDVHYFDLKVSPENNTDDISKKEIATYKKNMETILKLGLEDHFKEIHQKQVDDNYKAFKEILPTILDAKRNQYALIKNCKIVEYFSTFKDADKTGKLLYPDHMFSVQKVTDEVIKLGAFSL